MAVYNYSKYKIRIDPESKKIQGLRVGDIVRRQYFDYPNLIYSLMVVIETGVDIIGEKESSYFIGGLIEGDGPKSGELLDFVRVTNLFDPDRSGAEPPGALLALVAASVCLASAILLSGTMI